MTTEEPGFRITLATVYQEVQGLKDANRDLVSVVGRMDERLNAVLVDNKALKEEVTNLRSRFNGILVGIGTGMVIGVPALIAIFN